jgi:hypothetical protein
MRLLLRLLPPTLLIHDLNLVIVNHVNIVRRLAVDESVAIKKETNFLFSDLKPVTSCLEYFAERRASPNLEVQLEIFLLVPHFNPNFLISNIILTRLVRTYHLLNKFLYDLVPLLLRLILLILKSLF